MTKESNDSRQSYELESCLNQDELADCASELEADRKSSSLYMNLKQHFFTKDGIKQILNSNKLHIFVILLVIMDCTCISVELMLDFVISYNQEHWNSVIISNKSSSSELDLFDALKGLNSRDISILSSIEHTLRFVSIAILTFFVLEIVLKLIFIPYHLIGLLAHRNEEI
ncbi:hypothetical protein BpHYR1_011908 [Brachionus plicatilis]|uniref:Uncharacterized protein n=1 Tax=Brachionus plicatilis TaxID=10195 RepID=A0A3M7RHB6_BRAPC|nr:hypothetical protein BpHYR1_011908 [Brachionus plicatilis]